MRRSLGLDVLACPRCGGRLTLIALIDDPAVIGRMLQHLSLPRQHTRSTPPSRASGLDLGLTSGHSRPDVFSQAVILP